jgi:hypothetical protein
MRSRSRVWKLALGLLVLPVVAGVVVLEVRQAWGACSITWDGQQDTCIVALSSPVDGIFGDQVTTSVVTQDQIPWTLFLAYADGPSENILPATADVNPDSEEIDDSSPGCEEGDDSGCATFADATISGVLDIETSPGVFNLSAWDADHFNCGDDFNIDVQPSGGNCN